MELPLDENEKSTSLSNSISVKNKLLEIFRQSSLQTMRNYSSYDDIEIQNLNVEEKKRTILANQVSLIIISGKMMRMTFKIHFNLKGIKFLVSSYIQEDQGNITDEKAIDFAREYCNLIAGEIRKLFSEKEILLGLSVPVTYKGFYQVFDGSLESSAIHDSWKFYFGKCYSIYCSLTAQYSDINTLASLIS